MRLRVRVRRQTSRVELQGEDPSLTELIQVVRDTMLTSHGLRSVPLAGALLTAVMSSQPLTHLASCLRLSTDTHFSLSLNGSELLTDSGQTLSACGIVSGDLVCVVLPETPSGSNTHTQGNTHTQDNARTQSNTRSDDQSNAHSDTLNNSHSATLSQVSEVSPAGGLPGGPSGGTSGGPWLRTSSWEPMLCSEAEEGQVPLSLELLYHSAQTRSPSDALMVAVHLLMLETGFVSEVCVCVCGGVHCRPTQTSS